MGRVKSCTAYQILDSRGQTTLEVKILTSEGMTATASVPSGVSTGSAEAIAIDPIKAIQNINELIATKIVDMETTDQVTLDQKLRDLDGSADCHVLGANALLGVSLAFAVAGAMDQKIPLYWHLNRLFRKITGLKTEPQIPLPMMVMIEGGQHAQNNLCIQEFLISGELENGKKVYFELENILQEKGLGLKTGLEGGFTPNLRYDEDALQLIMQAAKKANLEFGKDIFLGMDIAANACEITDQDILTLYKRYPIYSLEDPIEEDKWAHWAQMKLELDHLGRDYLLIGDDLFVTDDKKLKFGIDNIIANAIIIKVNQTGTLTEALEVIGYAKKANFTHIVSHRAGETMDTFISDLAVATGAKFLKSGAPKATERVVKYNRLAEIAKEL